eukprot:scpid106243/ scgid13181/ 
MLTASAPHRVTAPAVTEWALFVVGLQKYTKASPQHSSRDKAAEALALSPPPITWATAQRPPAQAVRITTRERHHRRGIALRSHFRQPLEITYTTSIIITININSSN